MEAMTENSVLIQLMGFPPTEVVDWDIASDARVDWKSVDERLRSHPVEASIPLQYQYGYVNHQSPLELALLNYETPVPICTISSFIMAHPGSLCWNTLATAAVRGHASTEAINFLLDSVPAEISKNIAAQFLPEAVEMKNLQAMRALITRSSNSLSPNGCILGKELLECGRSDVFLERLKLLLREGTRLDVGGPEWAEGLLIREELGNSVMGIAIAKVLRSGSDNGWAHVSTVDWDILTTCIHYIDGARTGFLPTAECPIFISAIGIVPHSILIPLLKRCSVDFRHTGSFSSFFDTGTFWKFFTKAISVATDERDNKHWQHILGEILKKYGEKSEYSLTDKYWKTLFSTLMRRTSGKCVNDQGRLPMHIAAHSGLKWCEGLEEILKSNYSALEQRDGFTGMLPFQLAAIGSEPDPTIVYQLLKHRPNII